MKLIFTGMGVGENDVVESGFASDETTSTLFSRCRVSFGLESGTFKLLFNEKPVPQMKNNKRVKISEVGLVNNSIVKIVGKDKKKKVDGEKKLKITFSLKDVFSVSLVDFPVSMTYTGVRNRLEKATGMKYSQYSLWTGKRNLTANSSDSLADMGFNDDFEVEVKLVGSEETKKEMIAALALKFQSYEEAKSRPSFNSFDEFEKSIPVKRPKQCSKNPCVQTIVYIIVKKGVLVGATTASELFNSVVYVGTSSNLTDLWKCFVRHMKSKGYTEETHGLLILFTFDKSNCKPFKNPDEAAEGYELKTASFANAFSTDFKDMAGTTSWIYNNNLMDVFEVDEQTEKKYEEKIYNKLVKVLSEREFIEEE